MKYYLKLLLCLISCSSILEAAETVPLADSFPTAIYLKPAVVLEVAEVARAAFKPPLPTSDFSSLSHQQMDITNEGRKLGVVDEGLHHVIVAFRGTDSMFSREVLKYTSPCGIPFDGEEGYVHKGVASSFLPIATSKSFQDLLDLTKNNRRNKDYIFTGYGYGGALALLAALHFERRINRPAGSTPSASEGIKRNQLKIITFSSTKVVDHRLKTAFVRKFGKENVLQFQHYTDCSPTVPCVFGHVGIPIYILPFEQMRDMCHDSARWSKFLYDSLVVAGGVWLALNKDSNKDAFLTRGIVGTAVAAFSGIDAFLVGAPAIPSAESIFMAFMDTRHNIEDLMDMHRSAPASTGIVIPDTVGSVSMFSVQRGLLSYLYRCL